jgi:hypothetical protein
VFGRCARLPAVGFETARLANSPRVVAYRLPVLLRVDYLWLVSEVPATLWFKTAIL